MRLFQIKYILIEKDKAQHALSLILMLLYTFYINHVYIRFEMGITQGAIEFYFFLIFHLFCP